MPKKDREMEKDVVGRPMEILMVEDNLGDARLAIEALRGGQVKHRMTLVWDGEEAMQFLLRERSFSRAPRPDLVLLDLDLPKKDGREVLAEIRADAELRSIPVVVLTASLLDEDRTRSESLQVDGYMIKPVDLEKFLRLVTDLKRFWHAGVILPTACV
jgi:CheY-like chemotaxis protein